MKKLKGFTLVELIVVMAIMTILMAAIMNMMKPIRSTYVDSTYYATHSTAQKGIMTYITESIRCADDVGVYNGSGMSAQKAVEEFMDLTQITESDPAFQRINVIVIDNAKEYTDSVASAANTKYRGRLLRFRAPAAGVTKATLSKDENYKLALGNAFYGNVTYSIDVSAGTNTTLDVAVSSILMKSFNDTKGTDDVKTDNMDDYYCMTFNDSIDCANTQSRAFEYDCDSSTTAQGVKTYIVFTESEY